MTYPRIPTNLSYPTGRIFDGGREIYTYITPNVQAVYGGGAIVVGANLQPLFWGAYWESASDPSVGDVFQAVQRVLNSPYLSELAQYGFEDLTLNAPLIVTNPAPAAGSFSADDVTGMVWQLISDGTFPDPDSSDRRNIYMVFGPHGTQYTGSDVDAGGAHTNARHHTISFDVDNAWIAWVDYGGIDDITAVFSHELVETITDPEPRSGWVTTSPGDENELADVCADQIGMTDGVAVAAYFSNARHACVVPTTPWTRQVILRTQDALDPDRRLLSTGSATASNFCFTGTFSWQLFGQAEQLTVTADVSSYAKPVITWTVNGTSISGTTPVTAPVDPDTDPLSNLEALPAEVATIQVTADGATLVLRSTSGQGAVDLDVICTAVEDGLASLYDSQRTSEMGVTISGRVRVMDSAYDRAAQACADRRERLLHMAYKRVMSFVHRGDPQPGLERARKAFAAAIDQALAIAERTETGGTVAQ
jgi:hypothetical protein